MNLFGKKKKEENMQAAPRPQPQQNQMSLPELPKLPEFPKLKDDESSFFQSQTSQLPSYPSNYSGEKFSRNAIKEAVSGKRGDNEEVFDADESLDEDYEDEYDEDDEEDEEMMQETPRIMGKRVRMGSYENESSRNPGEPIFVRIDEFEESIELFSKSKGKVMEIEKLLSDMRKINEKEAKELKSWELEVQNLKKNFEKMDRNIFSKI